MPTPNRILLVDDDSSIREVLSMHLADRGFLVDTAGDVNEARGQATRAAPSLVILDMMLPDGSGLDLLPELRERFPSVPVLVITAHHDMASTILAIKKGAFDYIHKPIELDAFDTIFDRAIDLYRIGGQSEHFVETRGPGSYKMDDIVGSTPKMQAIFKDIGKLASSRATVLIQGESGTGKELIARVIHTYSAEAQPFVAINCSAIVDTLLESELFGHERGSFTGAVAAKAGKFELAADGTLFLDEIGDMSLALQAKLLRVLQEREFERVGGVKRVALRARIIAATNRDLAADVRAGKFREDLYQRLKVVTLELPPLRERREDIPRLVEHLLSKINDKLSKRVTKVPHQVMERLCAANWTGNVRELENVLTRAVVMAAGDVLVADIIPSPPPLVTEDSGKTEVVSTTGRPASLEDVERDHIRRAYTWADGHKGKTCQILGISRPTLERKLRKYRIEHTR